MNVDAGQRLLCPVNLRTNRPFSCSVLAQLVFPSLSLHQECRPSWTPCCAFRLATPLYGLVVGREGLGDASSP